MAKKVQVTLTGNEGKRLIAKAAVRMPEIQGRLEKHKILLCGGTTVSALSEELGLGPLRISGRIDASGARTALKKAKAPHNLLVDQGKGQNVDSSIQKVAETLNDKDLVIVGQMPLTPWEEQHWLLRLLGEAAGDTRFTVRICRGFPC